MKALLSAAVFAGCAASAGAAPPSLEIPPEVRPSGQYVQFVPKTDAVSVEYVGLDGIEPFPSAFLKDQRAFVLDATALVKGKRYAFVAVAAGKTGEQKRARFVVVAGEPSPGEGGGDTQPPPPPASDKFYFLIVRPDGPAAPAFSRAMALPEWDTLRAAGHMVKDVTVTEAIPLKANIPPAQLPAVLTLVVRPDGKSSQIVRPAVPLPTVGSGVLDLPKGVR